MTDKMNNRDFKNSLRSQIFKRSLVPLTLMTIAIVLVSTAIVRRTITDQIESELVHDAELIKYVYDEFYNGEFSIRKDENGENPEIYKGEQKISGDGTLLTQLADFLNIDISIFYEDVRIVTTLKDANGNYAVGTKSAVVVKNDVLEKNKSAFYDNVMVYDVKSFAYYMPLIGREGKTFGMIAVCRRGDYVEKEIINYVCPIAIVCIGAAVIFGLIMTTFNKKLADRISKMNRYMNILANGEFESEIPRELLAKDDEIKSLAMDGKRMAAAIRNLVDFDALTGLYNRRYADKKLKEIRIKSVEMGMKYCVCISDIDFFKQVNDTFGHEMGDYALKEVAEKLKKGMIGKGIAARWGGEEFMLIFENRELDIARRELEIIMNEVRTIWLPDSDRQITMSFGLTALMSGEDIDESLKRADANLYQAKEGGRNQIVCG